MIPFYRPERSRLTLRDALTEWRTGAPMLSVLPILWIYALLGSAL